MFPRRLPPSTPPLPAPSAAGNLAPTDTVSPTEQTQSGQLPQTSPIAGSSTALGPSRKRHLPLPATPRPSRPRTDAAALPAMPATSPRSHAALQQQTQAFSAIATALGHFGGMTTWLALDDAHRQALLAAATDLPPAPHSPGITEAKQRQQHLHEVLSSIQQITQHMDWLASQRQQLPHVIEPAMLASSVSAVHYGGMTINGPHVTPAGQRCFYLEQQYGLACAQHAVNAMVGGPLVSLLEFAWYEANAKASQASMPVTMEDVAADMQRNGVLVETVQGTLQALGMPTHGYAHRPLAHVPGLPGLDPVQARFLDALPTDRLLLQADRYEGNSTSSHYVAFRRDAGQWALLDSLHHVPQYGVAPSAYLLGDEKIRHFTALWPQHALQGQDTPVAVDGMGHDRQQGSNRGAHEEQGWQASAKKSAVNQREKPAATVAYDSHTATNHWPSRSAEFGQLLTDWNTATGQKSSGASLLQRLSALCDAEDAQGHGTPVAGSGNLVFEFTVTPPAGKAPVTVWRGLDGNGVPDLRLAPAPGDDQARANLLKKMQACAKISASHRREKPAGAVAYNSQTAAGHWKTRSTEFGPLLTEWDAATGQTNSGTSLLQHLSALCDAEDAQGRGTPIAGSGNRVFEFTVTPSTGRAPVTLWRGLDGNGVPDLRLAPAPGDDQARANLLKKMQVSAKNSASHRLEKPAAVIAYDRKTATNHWKTRSAEFGQLLTDWNTVTGQTNSGASLLRYLSALCDVEDAQGHGMPVADSGNRVFKFTVTLQAGSAPMTVWRGLDGNGVPDLRLAPAPGDDQAHANLLKKMQVSAKKSASHRREKPAAAIAYDYQTAANHWKTRSAEFGQLLTDWSAATDQKKSGASLLQHLSALCDAEDAQRRGTPVAGSGNLVFEFTVTPSAGSAPVSIWRGLDGNGMPDLRLAPAPGDDQMRADLLKKMQISAKKSIGKRREKPAATAYDRQIVKNHWKNRSAEFGQLLTDWNTATGQTNSGVSLLQHLAALCDAENAQGHGTPVVDSGTRVFEFTVTPSVGSAPVTVWRGLDGNGVPDLRLAPAPDDDQARANLLKKMQVSAKKSAGKQRK